MRSPTVIRVQLNGARLKVIFHHGLTIEQLFESEKARQAVRTYDELCDLYRKLAQDLGQTVSLILEAKRPVPGAYSAMSAGIAPGIRAR